MATITVDVPDELMAILERTARARGRPLDVEVREWLAVAARSEDAIANHELLERIRRTRAKLASAGVWITEEEIRKARDEGRA